MYIIPINASHGPEKKKKKKAVVVVVVPAKHASNNADCTYKYITYYYITIAFRFNIFILTTYL